MCSKTGQRPRMSTDTPLPESLFSSSLGKLKTINVYRHNHIFHCPLMSLTHSLYSNHPKVFFRFIQSTFFLVVFWVVLYPVSILSRSSVFFRFSNISSLSYSAVSITPIIWLSRFLVCSFFKFIFFVFLFGLNTLYLCMYKIHFNCYYICCVLLRPFVGPERLRTKSQCHGSDNYIA